MSAGGLFKKVDAITIRVPDLDAGIDFYVDRLGHRLKWRNESIGQAGLYLAEGDAEIVLTCERDYEPNWLVESADDAAEVFRSAGGQVVAEPHDIPVGRLAVVMDPFGNRLVVLDLSKGTYLTDDLGDVTGVG